MTRKEHRQAYLAGWKDTIGLTGDQREVEPELEDSYQAGWAACMAFMQSQAERQARNFLEPKVETGNFFPHCGHEEFVKDGKRICSWRVSVPGDLIDIDGLDRDTALRQLGEQAILEVSEICEDYVNPAIWSATHKEGEPGESFEVVFEVRRTSHAKAT